MAIPYEKVLITGASSGIGRGMALWFAKRGARVWATARRTKMLEELAAEGEGRITPVAMDVTKEHDTVTQIQQIDDACGGLDLVIANAGVGDATPAHLATWQQVERVLRINVTGAAATLTAVLPRMVARRKGHVVGVSSTARYSGLGVYSCYCGSKAFFSTFLQSLQVDLYGTPIKVTCIEPGFVRTDMNIKLEGKAPMPFRADVNVAVEKYCRAIMRGSRNYIFPKTHGISMKFFDWVPRPIFEPLAQKASMPQLSVYQAELAAKNA
jgi:short-subunit dehydrogenase